MVRLLLAALLVAALTLVACGGGSELSRDSAIRKDYYAVGSDAGRCGSPALMRCFIVAQPGAPDCDDWQWSSDKGTITDVSADGLTAWVSLTKPGTVHVWARGVDADGKDCTTPRHKILSSSAFNAPPVVIDFGVQPLFRGNDTERHLPYVEYRFLNGYGYDPEEGEIHSWSWGIYDGPDSDGDGLGDTLLAGKDNDNVVFTTIPDQMALRNSNPPQANQVAVRVWQTSDEVDREARIVVTVTDSTGASRKWGDGHVTLMKAYDDGEAL